MEEDRADSVRIYDFQLFPDEKVSPLSDKSSYNIYS